jgi:hypothetical protein
MYLCKYLKAKVLLQNAHTEFDFDNVFRQSVSEIGRRNYIVLAWSYYLKVNIYSE